MGMVIGAIAGWLAHALLRRPGDEDRPPIIVRGGSISFDTDVGWTDDGADWKPYHPDGRPVRELVAFIRKTGGPDCAGRELRGRALHFQHVHRFMVTISGGEPRVNPKGLLMRDKTTTRVRFENGPAALGEVKALPSSRTDWVAEDEEVCICFDYEER